MSTCVNNSSTGSAVPDGLIDPSGTHMINLPSPLTQPRQPAPGRGRPDHVREVRSDTRSGRRRCGHRRDAHQLRRPVARFDGRHRQHRLHRQLAHVGALGAGRRDHATARGLTGLWPDHHRAASAPRVSPSIRTSTTCTSATSRRSSTRATRSTTSRPHRPRIRSCCSRSWATRVVPNNATDRLIVAGGLTKYSSGTHAVGPGTGAYVTFTQGSHGTLFDPTASPAATVEMQGEAIIVHGNVRGARRSVPDDHRHERHRAVTPTAAQQR